MHVINNSDYEVWGHTDKSSSKGPRAYKDFETNDLYYVSTVATVVVLVAAVADVATDN